MRGDLTYFCDLVGVLDPALVPAEIAAELGVIETSDKDPDNAVTAALREDCRSYRARQLGGADRRQRVLGGIARSRAGTPGGRHEPSPAGDHRRGRVSRPATRAANERRARGDRSVACRGCFFSSRLARSVVSTNLTDRPRRPWRNYADASMAYRWRSSLPRPEPGSCRRRPSSATSRPKRLGCWRKAGDDDRRHGSLDAVLTWSLDLLEDNEAEVLGAVAICPGGFDLAIADALAARRTAA